MVGAVGGADLARELERVADRLRVLGPRPAAAATLVRARTTLQLLADLAADAEGRPRRGLPELAPHGLGDQVLVLGHDLLDATADRPLLRAAGLEALVELRRAL